jgi:uncharacterized damage-inducible protein DinB
MKPREQFAHWETVRRGLIDVIDRFREAELDYSPFAGSRRAGDIMLHIADAEDGWFRYVVTRDLDEWPSQYTLENYPDRDAIKEVLGEVHGRTDQYLDSLSTSDLDNDVETPWGDLVPLRSIIWHVLEHEIHHRGELSILIGLLGREGLEV